MTISTLPDAPSRNAPATFSTLADAFIGALPTFVTEANALASDVTTKQSTASTAATTATTKAAEALASADAAAASETAAETAASEAATLTESYQGSLSSDPTLDKNGGALAAGDWYIKSSTGYIRAYTGSAWVQGLSDVSGVTSLNGSTGALTGFVTETGTVTLSNKTAEALVLTNGYTEEVYAVSGTTPALDAVNGSIQTWALSANSTPTSNLATGQSIILGITDGTAYSVTWPSVTWTKSGGSGAAPTLNATVTTWVVLWKVGSTLYGSYLGDA